MEMEEEQKQKTLRRKEEKVFGLERAVHDESATNPLFCQPPLLILYATPLLLLFEMIALWIRTPNFLISAPCMGHASRPYCLWSLTRADCKEDKDHCLLNTMGTIAPTDHFLVSSVWNVHCFERGHGGHLNDMSEADVSLLPLICNISTSKCRSISEECGSWYCWQNCILSSSQHSNCKSNTKFKFKEDCFRYFTVSVHNTRWCSDRSGSCGWERDIFWFLQNRCARKTGIWSGIGKWVGWNWLQGDWTHILLMDPPYLQIWLKIRPMAWNTPTDGFAE